MAIVPSMSNKTASREATLPIALQTIQTTANVTWNVGSREEKRTTKYFEILEKFD
jgi:hypothetical protein